MASVINIETRTPLYLTAGVSPGFAVGGFTFVNVVTPSNSSLSGWSFTLEIIGIGKLFPGTDYTFDGVNTITVIRPGYTGTIADERWIVEFQPKTVGAAVPSTTQIEYSNGYRVADVMTALMNRRRWRKPTRTDFTPVLTGLNVWADDDIYSPVFDAEHKAVNAYNVWVTQEDKDISSDNFNVYLQQLQRDCVLKCLNTVFSKRERLEKVLMFDRFGRTDYVNPNTGQFVGVRITPAKMFDVSVQIDSVALLFDSDKTFNLYVFHDSQPTVPIATISVTSVANVQTEVKLGTILSYAGVGKKSGCFYVGYFQDDLGSAQGINEIVQRFNPMYNFGCVPIELPVPATHQVNVSQVSFTMKTHGMNFQLSAFRDFTQLIVDSPHLFDNLLGLQMAADVIELIQNSLRSNKDERITGDMLKTLYSDLNLAVSTDEIPFSVGLKTRIQKEIYRVMREFFPKEKATSITHDTNNQRDIYGAPADILLVSQY